MIEIVNDIFIYPTDTVWGIGSVIYSEEGNNRVRKIKNNLSDKPMSILFGDFYEIANFFDLPKEMDSDWLKTFFSFESTLGIKKLFLKRPVPSWIIAESQYVAIRCIENESIASMIKIAGGPITSTSLNESGGPPVVEEREAEDFKERKCPDAIFIRGEEGKLSGNSSTIVLYDNSQDHQIIRAGKFVKEIEEHLGLLST